MHSMIFYTYIIDMILNNQDFMYLNIIFISSSRAPVLYCCLASWLLLPEGHPSAGFPIALHTDYACSLTENSNPPLGQTPLAAYLFVCTSKMNAYVTKALTRAVRMISSNVNTICTARKAHPRNRHISLAKSEDTIVR